MDFCDSCGCSNLKLNKCDWCNCFVCVDNCWKFCQFCVQDFCRVGCFNDHNCINSTRDDEKADFDAHLANNSGFVNELD